MQVNFKLILPLALLSCFHSEPTSAARPSFATKIVRGIVLPVDYHHPEYADMPRLRDDESSTASATRRKTEGRLAP
jgi:hypothetical protein